MTPGTLAEKPAASIASAWSVSSDAPKTRRAVSRGIRASSETAAVRRCTLRCTARTHQRAEQTEDRSHRAAGDQRRLQAGGLEEREGREVHVARASASTADEDQMALAHFPVEALRGQAVPELML